MRILHVIQELRPGGAERLVVTLTRSARDAGHEVAVAAGPGALATEIEAPSFRLPLVERHPTRVLGAATRLRSAFRAWRPDVLHVHNPGMAAVAGLATLRGRRVPGIVSVHGVPDEDYRPAARVLRWSGLPVVACGPGIASGLADAGLQVRRMVANAVGPAPTPADRSTLARELGVPASAPLIVTAGRLSPVKDQFLSIRALRDLPDAVLLVLGEGPLRDDLRRAADAWGVGDRVILAGYRPDARALIGAADVVTLTSVSEGLPLVALEALAAGRPIVATAVRGIRDLLTGGVDALLVPRTSDAMAAALRSVLGDADLAGRLVAAGRETARGYSEEAMVQAYLDLYAEAAPR